METRRDSEARGDSMCKALHSETLTDRFCSLISGGGRGEGGFGGGSHTLTVH